MGKGGEHARVILDAAVKQTTEIGSSSTKNGGKDGTTAAETAAAVARPWYRRGGMHVNMVGMGLNVTLPPIFLAVTATGATYLNDDADYTPAQIFAALYFSQVGLAYALHGMRTVFCVVAVPCYVTSLLVIPGTLATLGAAPAVGLAVAISMWKVAVCMSACLHRYAAHAAFKCGPVTQWFVNVLGCAAHQGGPIWWASQHRAHHKYCDLPRDPHSAIQDGVEDAFAFFGIERNIGVNEEFTPKHNDTWYLRLLDTWSFAVCTVEMAIAYHLFGREGLFVCYTSLWICQTITLWFNIANHPPDANPGQSCKAANAKAKPTGWYPAFLLLDFLYPYFDVFCSEGNHGDHHKHAMLAKRDATDFAYFSFIWPLEQIGLVWDVKNAPPK